MLASHLISAIVACASLVSTPAQSPDYEKLKAEAERHVAEGSYKIAHELYERAEVTGLPAAAQRWVRFRLADTAWRVRGSIDVPGDSVSDAARRQLDAMVAGADGSEEHDRVWVEAQESLGDFWWTRAKGRDWDRAWPHYQKALDWWADSSEIELARERYLAIAWRIGGELHRDDWHSERRRSKRLPVDVMENAVRIATNESDKSRAHFLLALSLGGKSGDDLQPRRVVAEFEAAMAPGKSVPWYGVALSRYARWLAESGREVRTKDGLSRRKPDFPKALEVYRQLVEHHRKGETPFFDDAERQIREITSPSIDLYVGDVFASKSEINFGLNWRNVQTIDLALYSVDLTRDVRLPKDENWRQWVSTLELTGREKVRSWSKETGDAGEHIADSDSIQLEGRLPAGAYVVEARGGGTTARELILVTDITVVLKTRGEQAMVYVCHAMDGSPVARARVDFWHATVTGDKHVWMRATKESDARGLCTFSLPSETDYTPLFVAASADGQQTFFIDDIFYGTSHEPWHVFVHTDRPAYRPNETVQWKCTARTYDGTAYSTPAKRAIEYEITGPRQLVVARGKVTLNEFGSAWGSLDLSESLPLGDYDIRFWDDGRDTTIGADRLFRLEEYKLPEFKVNVSTSHEAAEKRSRRGDEKIDVTVQAEYYFGGSVAGATVVATIHETQFDHSWDSWGPRREFPWLYSHRSNWRYWTSDREIEQHTMTTDATGKATVSFHPQPESDDVEYRIEARVTDASRREVVGSGKVRVTRHDYFVHLRPDHKLVRPQEQVKVELKTLDANDRPIRAEGTVTVTRDTWSEVWIDPTGREVQGDELRELKRTLPAFPPPPVDPGADFWQLKSEGYRHEQVSTHRVQTNASGEGEIRFKPEREGFYRITWTSDTVAHVARVPESNQPASRLSHQVSISADTTVWVATPNTTEFGYHGEGLEMIVDQDTARPGQKALVLIAVEKPGRHVLFHVEDDDFSKAEIVHVPGTVKMIEVAIEPRHVPNLWLTAVTLNAGELLTHVAEIIVPPVEHVLAVEVQPDREQYEPGEESTLTVITRDHTGKPIAAEVSLAVVDESVYYIQEESDADPRDFCYGVKRGHPEQAVGGFDNRFVKLVKGPGRRLVDVLREGTEEDGISGGLGGLSFGGGMGGFAVGRNVREASRRRYRDYEDDDDGYFVAKMSLVVNQSKKVQAVHDQVAFLPEQQAAQEPTMRVRTDFRSTAVWEPAVVTDANGRATVKRRLPDSTTQWRITARAATTGTQFGLATATTRTEQPLIVRLQAPRFFVVGDSAMISAIVNNETEQPMTVRPSLEAHGVSVAGILLDGRLAKGDPTPIDVPAHSESRVDWLVAALKPGQARFRVSARGDKFADGMERSFPVYPHGIEKLVARSGKLSGDESAFDLDLPNERLPESTTLTVQVTPSLAVTMLDSLPYLIDYPYGCTEQTMSRFLPAAIIAKTLKDLGLKPEDIMDRLFVRVDPDRPAHTQPRGGKDLRQLDHVVQLSLDRLYEFQHSDGGWGWWKAGASDHFMTAYVVWGLVLARDAGIRIQSDVLSKAVRYLDEQLPAERFDLDVQAWMLHALAAQHASARPGEPNRFQDAALENLRANRHKLNASTRALVALSAHHLGHADLAKSLLDELAKQAQHGAATDTAHWGGAGIHGRWSEGGVEATAFALRAFLAIDSKHPLVDPVTNWLIQNRRGARWSNTRDTAITVLALNDFLRTSVVATSDCEFELTVNGRHIVTRKLAGKDALTAPSQFVIDPKMIRSGANQVQVRRTAGDGPIYFAASARFFSTEEPVAATSNGLSVRRQYHKLLPRPTLLNGHAYDRHPIADGDTITSGERIEAVLTITTPNDLEYLAFEDLKPAGVETVQVRSSESLYAREIVGDFGDRINRSRHAPRDEMHHAERDVYANAGRSRWVYQELRDRKVVLFLDKLPAGVWEIRYELRAEVPGTFHCLPVIGYAMYLPEIQANGAEVKLSVKDRPTATAR